jgi:hypothetical protein
VAQEGKEVRIPTVDSIWIHFKGGVYRVSCVGKMEATLELHVVYKPVGAAPADPPWIRPLRVWYEMVADETGRQVQRFAPANNHCEEVTCLTD